MQTNDAFADSTDQSPPDSSLGCADDARSDRRSVSDDRDRRSNGRGRWLRVIGFLFVFGMIALAVGSLPLDALSESLRSWIGEFGIGGPVVLAAIYVIATVLFVPGTILTLAAGALFGLWVGTATASVGSTLGASFAFLIARYLARDRVVELAKRNRNFGAIDQAIEEGGWKVVGLLRLSPAIPFNLQNYLYGLTPVRFWPYVLTSWIAMLPGTFLYVYIGHVTGAAVTGDRARGPLEWGMLVIGLSATLAVTVYLTRLARGKLREQAERAGGEADLVDGGVHAAADRIPR